VVNHYWDQNTSQFPAAAQGADRKKLEQQVGKQLQALVISGQYANRLDGQQLYWCRA
jgi:hypothetical protein